MSETTSMTLATLASPAADDFRQEEPRHDHHHYRL